MKKSLLAFVGILGLIVVIALMTPTSGRGQGSSGNAPPAQNVNVVNTPSVNVVNSASSPALVRDVGVPVRTPVQIPVNVFMQFGETALLRDVYTVPEGKRLVIEHVSLLTDTLGPGNAVRGGLLTLFEGENSSHHFDVRAQTPVGGPLFVVNHPMLAFADPGTRVQMEATIEQAIGSGSGGFSAFRGTLSGYLENAQ